MSIPIIALLKETVTLWLDHKAFRLSAALAYYALFSLGPLLVIFIGISGLVLGEQEVRQHLTQEMRSLVGESGADTVQSMVQSLNSERGNVLSTVLGGFMLLFGAGGVFGQLKDALNTIWEVKPKPGLGIMTFIRDRFLSFTMVLGTGFLLLISLAVTTLLAALNKRLETLFSLPTSVWLVFGFFISLAVISVLFAMFFKYLPDAKIAWRDDHGSDCHGASFQSGEVRFGLLPRSSEHGLLLWRRRRGCDHLVVDLLWIADSSFRRGVYAGVCPDAGAENCSQGAFDTSENSTVTYGI